MYVKIVSCWRNTWWYSNKIGKVYKIDSQNKDSYCIKRVGTIAHIKQDDAREVRWFWPWQYSRDINNSWFI